MNRRIHILALLAGVLCVAEARIASPAHAATRLVPGQYATIQQAIDDCNDGDTVIIAPGTYTGDGNRDIDFKGKAITVRSENGPEHCIIDCEGYSYRGFHFHSGEAMDSVLDGFTVTNAHAAACRDPGGAILCSASSPTISNCIIANNVATSAGCRSGKSYGGGIGIIDSSPILIDCTISGNWAFTAGGGIYCKDSVLTMQNCLVVGNSAPDGSGLWLSRSEASLDNCTFMTNTGTALFCLNYSNAAVNNSIFWANEPDQIHLGYLDYADKPYPATISFSFCDVQGSIHSITIEAESTLNWGPGNIDIDPMIVSPGCLDGSETWDYRDDFWVDGDYHLQSRGWRWDAPRGAWTWDEVTSRCIDAGNPSSPLADEPLSVEVDPTSYWGRNVRINMGAYGGTAEAAIPPNGWTIDEDHNNDGILNFTDFAWWAGLRADVVGDSSADLALIANRWLDQTTWFGLPIPMPGAATNPDPPDGAAGVRLYPLLSWRGSVDATSHDVYFSATNPPLFQRNQPGTTFQPRHLSAETRFYWRVDEIKPCGTTTGRVWTFTTQSRGGGGGR